MECLKGFQKWIESVTPPAEPRVLILAYKKDEIREIMKGDRQIATIHLVAIPSDEEAEIVSAIQSDS